MAADIGKVFEDQVKEVLSSLRKTHFVEWRRFTDTGAAGSVVSEQPSDYLVGLPPGSAGPRQGRLFFLEVKASEKNNTLQKAMVKSSQRGAINCFRRMLDIPYLILFWDSVGGSLQLWDGIAVSEDRLDKRHILAQWHGIGSINRLLVGKVADHLVDHFLIPDRKFTLANLR